MNREREVDLNVVSKMGQGDAYIAPDSHFISAISLFSSSLPWEKFERFFESKKIVNLESSEQLILLRLIALQEYLCLNDDELLNWTKQQLYLFSFMQPNYKARLPTKALLRAFRKKFDEVGLLKPFRKQCQRIIQEHQTRLPPLESSKEAPKNGSIDFSSPATTTILNKMPNTNYHRKVDDTKVDLPNIGNNSDTACPSCGSHNVIKLTPSQDASTRPNIQFARCRFCGNTFKD